MEEISMKYIKHLAGQAPYVALCLFVAFCALAARHALAVNPPYECSDAPQLNKSKCTAVMTTAWQYSIQPVGSSQSYGSFRSAAEAFAVADSITAATNAARDFCS